MNIKRFIAIASISIMVFATSWVTPAFAVESPSFPACANPQGTLQVSYPSGNHGIVGDSQSFNGADSVYDLPEGNHMQCFCSVDGSGIQTNWWKVSSLTEEQIQILKNQGWFYVPNGALWGLSADPYLAINGNYTCGGGGSGGGNNGGGGGGTGGSSSSGGTGGGQTLAASTAIGQVLGLASTGDSIIVYTFTIFGMISLLLGLILRKDWKISK